MFRRLATAAQAQSTVEIGTSAIAAQPKSAAQALVELHPAELMVLLELAWNRRRNVGNLSPPSPGHPQQRSDVPGLPTTMLTPVFSTVSGPPPDPVTKFATLITRAAGGILWDHLIYAYMIENTRIYEIFRRVVHEFLHGEKLGAPGSPSTQLWLRNTEELFYQNPPPLSITSISSDIRPNLRASRRNAYQRMFAMELNHGSDENIPYPYVRADAANTEFVPTFEELLREVWIGHINRSTTSGANPTDDAKIAELTTKLHDMLITRRQGGNLSREEFFFVSMMSWFHLTVDSDLPIIVDLRAQGASAEQRLFKIAQLVGLPAHGLSRSFLDVAEVISEVLITIESGALNGVGAARAYYDPAVTSPGVPNNLANAMNTIAMQWSTFSGRNMKASRVASS